MYRRIGAFLFLLLILSANSQENRKIRMGCNYKDPTEVKWMHRGKIDIDRARPDSLYLTDGIPPVSNQWPCGSCVAWAASYYYKTYQEYVDHNEWDVTDRRHKFNPMFMYNHINGGTDNGANLPDAMKFLCDLGAGPKSSVAIDSSDYISWASEKGFSDAINYRSDSAFYISVGTNAGIEALKQHLANDNDAAIFAIYVWDPFYNDNLGPNDIYDTGDKTGSIQGGHALCIVGYNDSLSTPDGKGAFRVVNSWGTYWGDNGYFWMTYEAMKDGNICWGRAYYTKDRRNYQPKAKLTCELEHNKRYSITMKVGAGDGSSPSWESDSIFNWAHSVGQQHPFPDNPIVLDLTDGADKISSLNRDTVYVKINDDNFDFNSGTVHLLSAGSYESGLYSASVDTPQSINDYGTTRLDLTFPLGKTQWQSFHRLPNNTGWTPLPGDIDSITIDWFYPTGDTIYSSPSIANLDTAGNCEIVFGSNDSTVYALNYRGNQLWSYKLNGKVLGSPSVTDVDGDRVPEVIVCSDNKEVACIHGSDGSEDWKVSGLLGGVNGSPTIGFIDYDDTPEVIVPGTFLRCLNAEDGSVLWMQHAGTPIPHSSPAVGNFYDDGYNDVVVGRGNSVKMFDGKTGSIIFTYNTSGTVNSSPLVADIDADSVNEIVFGSENDTLYAVQIGTDSLLWKYGTGGGIYSSPAACDVDGDSRLEIAFASRDGYIYLVEGETGTLAWSYSTGSEVLSSPVIADFDGDHTLDIVCASTNGKIYGISACGGSVSEFDIDESMKATPAVGDIDGDGYMEFAIGTADGNLYCINSKTSGAGENISVNKMSLSEFKKPVNGKVTVNYSISKESKVEISIFDAAGRNIATPVSGKKSAGYHKFTLKTDGFTSGVYFMKMTSGDSSLSRKMILVR